VVTPAASTLESLCQSDGVADQANEREGPHSAEGKVLPGRAVFFPLQPYQERQEQDQKNLHSLWR